MSLKIGLIGAGAMGLRHLDALSRDARVEIVGVADAIPEIMDGFLRGSVARLRELL